jgi:hypothetical protein
MFCLPAITSAARNPHIDPKAEETHDGLYRVKRAKFDTAWIRPEIDLSGYSKLWVHGAGFAFRPVKGSGSRYAAWSGRNTEFPISEENQQKLQEVMREIFIEELGKIERYTLVDSPGPDVLLMVGGVIDVVSKVPPEPIGRGDIYLSSVGEATLVLELRDSDSKAILARVADRRAAEPAFPQSANSVTNWSEVRRLARTWARLIVRRLNEVVGVSEGVVEKE